MNKWAVILIAVLMATGGLLTIPSATHSPSHINASPNTTTFSVSANQTNTYPITLTNVPSGTGYYQQLITINNPSKYGINTAGSNIEFSASNGTLLYAWIQSINSSAIQVWVKNYDGSSTINMEVLLYFENLLSANGYIGISSLDSENNYKLVFSNLSALSSYSMYTPFVSISYMYYQNGSGESDLVYNANLTNNNNLSVHASLRSAGSNDYFIFGVLNSASGTSFPASPSHSFKDIAGYYYVEMNAYTSTKYGMEVNGTGLVNVSFSFTPTEGQEMSLQNSNGYIYGTLHPQTMPTFTIGNYSYIQSHALAGKTVRFYANANEPSTYQWYINSVAVSGATGQYFNTTFQVIGSYSVYVVATNSSSSTATSNTIDITTLNSYTVVFNPGNLPSTMAWILNFNGTVYMVNGGAITLTVGAGTYHYIWYSRYATGGSGNITVG